MYTNSLKKIKKDTKHNKNCFVFRGNLRRSLELFEKAISLAKTELEMTHLFSLKDAAAAQLKVSERWGLDWTVS